MAGSPKDRSSVARKIRNLQSNVRTVWQQNQYPAGPPFVAMKSALGACTSLPSGIHGARRHSLSFRWRGEGQGEEALLLETPLSGSPSGSLPAGPSRGVREQTSVMSRSVRCRGIQFLARIRISPFTPRASFFRILHCNEARQVGPCLVCFAPT